MIYPSQIAVLITLLNVGLCLEDLTFPPGFKFGVATSAYQIEGAWDVADKSENIWDVYSHKDKTWDGKNGDIACDSYRQWKRDIEMLSELGVNFYRFSLSWSRILPSGYMNIISEDGVKYYNKLINGLLANGIEPVITLYHWDLPQTLQDLGGWTNPLVADWFADYARVAYQLFGDRVKMWLTINEPVLICEGSYTWAIVAPAIKLPDEVGSYLCNKNVLLAHAKAWRVYDEEFRAQYHGQVSWADHLVWHEPENDNHTELPELTLQHSSQFSYPILSKRGGWPPVTEKIIAENSAKQGYFRSRLPAFTEEEIKLVKGTYDFYCINFGPSRVVVNEKPNKTDLWPHGAPEFALKFRIKSAWKEPPYMDNSDDTVMYLEGLRHTLAWMKKQYGDIKILITDNGYPSQCTAECDSNDLDDYNRINYIKKYLTSILKAIKEDGVNVIGYTYWSLMDNYEWFLGYTMKYGLYTVDFGHPNRTRTPRQSAYYYSNIIKNRVIIEDTGNLTASTSIPYLWYTLVVILLVIIVSQCIYIYKIKWRKSNSELVAMSTHVPLLKHDIELISKEKD